MPMPHNGQHDCLCLLRLLSSASSLHQMRGAMVWRQVTAVARQAFRRAVLEASPRLVEAMFLCEVSAASEVLSGAL